MNDNVYLNQVVNVLPRAYGFIDNNPISPSYGVGDRFFSQWKGRDFINGTFQILPNILYHLSDIKGITVSKKTLENSLKQTVSALKLMNRIYWGLDEILPFEGSYCVTALVLSEICEVIMYEEMSEDLKKDLLTQLKPLAEFVKENREDHGIITNHLSTALHSLVVWQKVTNDDCSNQIKDLLDIILNHQSSEGWYLEYSGADPGYQTLAIDYLARVHRLRPDLNLKLSLQRSLKFLTYCCHPDGTFGGNYGSRNTRFVHPGGIELLADEIEEAREISQFLRHSIKDLKIVTMMSVDDSNLYPLLASYSRAAKFFKIYDVVPAHVPSLKTDNFELPFKEAGFIIKKTTAYFFIASWKRGGTYLKINSHGRIESGGVVGEKNKERLVSQNVGKGGEVEFSDEKMVFTVPMGKINLPVMNPYKFIVLRLLALTAFRSKFLTIIIKKILVKLLIAPKMSSTLARRVIKWNQEDVWVQDEPIGPGLILDKVLSGQSFSHIHMASQGYWQMSDYEK